jgi:hypothetical protein
MTEGPVSANKMRILQLENRGRLVTFRGFCPRSCIVPQSVFFAANQPGANHSVCVRYLSAVTLGACGAERQNRRCYRETTAPSTPQGSFRHSARSFANTPHCTKTSYRSHFFTQPDSACTWPGTTSRGDDLGEHRTDSRPPPKIGDDEKHTSPPNQDGKTGAKGRVEVQFKRLKRLKLGNFDSGNENACFPTWNKSVLLVQEGTVHLQDHLRRETRDN